VAWLAAPRPLIEFLRATRTCALMLAGAVEKVLQTEGGRPTPPLWLLRHTGPVAHVESSADATDRLVGELGLAADARIVDAGCGFGAMAMRLTSRLGPDGRYLGFDIHGPSIRWAQIHIATSDPRVRFVLVRRDPSEAWPVADQDADFVIAKSLFTHLPEPAARAAFREMARSLRPGGRALVTAFLFEEDRSPDALLPYPGVGARVRWRWRNRPEAVVAYERTHFTKLLMEAGLVVESFRPGFWPKAEKLDAQDTLILVRS